jgi:hypothetical protein
MISRAVPRSDRRQAATAQPHPVGSPVATGGGTVLTTMSQLMAQRCAHDPTLRPLPGRCLSRPGAIDPRNTRASDGSRSKGFGGRRAPKSCSVNPHTIAMRGAPVPQPRAGHTPAGTAHRDLRGFGCVPWLSPGVAPDGDDAHSRPPQPHRGDTSGSAGVNGDPDRRSGSKSASSDDKTLSPLPSTIRVEVIWEVNFCFHARLGFRSHEWTLNTGGPGLASWAPAD